MVAGSSGEGGCGDDPELVGGARGADAGGAATRRRRGNCEAVMSTRITKSNP